jgi:hypothetical protein
MRHPGTSPEIAAASPSQMFAKPSSRAITSASALATWKISRAVNDDDAHPAFLSRQSVQSSARNAL